MSWREAAKAMGWTDEQLKALETANPKAGEIFESVIKEAADAKRAADAKVQEATEKEKKINTFWENDATPKINDAYSKVAAAQAEAAFYRTQAEEAKKLGFVKADAPGYKAPDPANPNPNPNPTPGFNPNPVPGSPGAPKFMTTTEAMGALTTVSYLMSEHQRLFGEPLPSLEELMNEAQTRGVKAKDVWETKYNVKAKRDEIAAAAQKKHDDAVAEAAVTKWKTDNADKLFNENTRPQGISMHPKYAGVDAQGKPDKLAWTKEDRGQALRDRIKQQVAKEQPQRVM
jgi:hypothetical protein